MKEASDTVEPPRAGWRSMLAKLGNRLLAGIAVAIPLVVTYWVLAFGYRIVNGLSEPWLKAFGLSVPGLGFVITLLMFIGLGVMAKHVIGRRVLERIEQFLLRIPVVSAIYAGTKQVLHSLQGAGGGKKFKRVVLVEYLTPGSYLFGFATGRITAAGSGRELTMVFVPTAPNPTTGLIIAFPSDRIIGCDMTIEEATKILFSGGLVTPSREMEIFAGLEPKNKTDV